MEIKLMKLEIHNFKGIKDLVIDFDGCNTEIHGDNATGKTTVKDSFNWLLFGKNAEGKTDFGIKPVDENGDVVHRLETSVEATFEVDGNPKQFKETLKESWTRKRGAATETFTGHETNFYVNTVPKKKTEYTVEINKLINEDLFKMITDPLYFNQIGWKERRAMLLDICGNISDDEVFEQDKELLPLKAELQGKTVDELKSILSRGLKAINHNLSVIPEQIAEAERAKPTSLVMVDLTKKKELQAKVDELTAKKNNIINGYEITTWNANKKMFERDIEALSKSVVDDITKAKAYKDFYVIENARVELQNSINQKHFEIDRIETRLKENASAKQRLSAEWDIEFAKTFFGDICPTCNQQLPPNILEEKKRAFNAEKAMKLDRIEQDLKGLKQEGANLTLTKTNLLSEIQDIEKAIEGKIEEIRGKKEEAEKEIAESKAHCHEEQARLISQIAQIDEQIANYNEISKSKLEDIEKELAVVNEHLHQINVLEAGYELEKRQDERIKELMDRQVELSRLYMDNERLLALAEAFIITKVSMLNDKINRHFKYASFKLFNQNINGGIEETCEVTYNGIPYKDLNTASRVNIGLDIINTLCKKHGITAPIFIDGAEAVTKFIPTKSQKVLLVVDKDHKELNVQKEM